MNALLIGGLYFAVPGLDIVAPGEAPWCRLDPRDYRTRRSSWVRQVIVHSTKGIWPQHVKPGAGPVGREKVVADFWRRDPQHSAAQLVIGSDGTVACLADLATVAAFHATVSNDWSVGIEVYQEADGGIYEAALASLRLLVPAVCDAMAIPFQIPTAYRGRPLARMLNGGRDCVGVFGHRDNTHQRGRGDPGDIALAELELAGAERIDFDRREDISRWMRRQQWLVNHGDRLVIDGVCGPATISAMRRRGLKDGHALDRAAAGPPLV